MNKLFIISAIVLIFIVAAEAGFLLLNPRIGPTGNQAGSSQPYTIPPLNKYEKIVLTIKKSDIAEKKRDYNIIQAAAKKTNVLNVKDCKVYPIVMQIAENAKFTIVNHDNVMHKIETDKAHEVFVQPNSSGTFTANFGHGPGLYSIVCDNDNSPLVGMFLVTPQFKL